MQARALSVSLPYHTPSDVDVVGMDSIFDQSLEFKVSHEGQPCLIAPRRFFPHVAFLVAALEIRTNTQKRIVFGSLHASVSNTQTAFFGLPCFGKHGVLSTKPLGVLWLHARGTKNI